MAIAINGISATYALTNATASRAFRTPGMVREVLGATTTSAVTRAPRQAPNPGNEQADRVPGGSQSRTPVAPGSDQQLDPDARRELEYLKSVDREVRAHEQAHVNAAGSLAGGPATYVYKRGPDGGNYAIAGEVPLEVRKGQTPEETLSLARRIQAAALAPAQPSAEDRAIAAAAAQMAAEAAAELAQRSNLKAARPPGAPFPARADAEDPRNARSAALARRYAESAASIDRPVLAVA